MAIVKNITIGILVALIGLTSYNIYLICVIYSDLIWPQKILDPSFLLPLIGWKLVLLGIYGFFIYVIFVYDQFFQMLNPVSIITLIVLIALFILQILWVIADFQTVVMTYAIFEIFNPENWLEDLT